MFLRSAELRPSHAHAFFSRESGSTRVSTNNGRSSCLNHIHNVLPDHCMLLFQETPTHLTCTRNTVDISPIKAQVPTHLSCRWQSDFDAIAFIEAFVPFFSITLRRIYLWPHRNTNVILASLQRVQVLTRE